ncbi:MAG: nucleoside 2-deoxyribosyltransferase [Anaerolineaceae bacterium]
MNIYFSCSITGGRSDQRVYQTIVNTLLAAGHEVPTAILSSAEVMDLEAVVSPEEVFRRDVAWVEACDLVVAEVSTPSHGVGYEIALALCLGKPVLCFYQTGRKVSKMITGNTHERIKSMAYADEKQLVEQLNQFLT